MIEKFPGQARQERHSREREQHLQKYGGLKQDSEFTKQQVWRRWESEGVKKLGMVEGLGWSAEFNFILWAPGRGSGRELSRSGGRGGTGSELPSRRIWHAGGEAAKFGAGLGKRRSSLWIC